MKLEIKTEIKINAPKEVVWKVLTAFDEYHLWNPFIKSITGNVEVGQTIKVDIQKNTFKPKILVFEKNLELKWLGSLLFKGLFDGEHRFLIQEASDGTVTFFHSEKFNGILVRFFKRMLENETTEGFHAMNEKLKESCEKLMSENPR